MPSRRIVFGLALGIGIFIWIGVQGGLLPDPSLDQPRVFAGLAFVLLSRLGWVLGIWLSALGFGVCVSNWVKRGLPTNRERAKGDESARAVSSPASQPSGSVDQLSSERDEVGLTGGELAATGFGIWAWLVLVVGMLGGYAAWGAALVTAIGWAAGGWVLWKKRVGAARTEVQSGMGILLWTPGLGLLIVAACCPPGTLWATEAYGYDVLSYHLQLPREWLAGGQVIGLTHNVYSFLPSLMESAYGVLMMGPGERLEAVYSAQLLHVSLALVSAVCVAQLVYYSGRGLPEARRAFGAALAGAAVLLTPWVLITGSSAYNEMLVVALFATAVSLVGRRGALRWRRTLLAGGIVGLAILAKPTAVLLVGLPMVVVIACCGLGWVARGEEGERWRFGTRWRRWGSRLGRIAGGVGVALLVVSPWLVRNQVQTGNAIFPLAIEYLGAGHWGEQQVQRWNRGHDQNASIDQRPEAALWNQWLGNVGYGAVGGGAVRGQSTQVARFEREGGVSLLWLAAAFGLVLGATRRTSWRFTLAALVLVLVQLAGWINFTHWQSRFLVPTVVPAAMLVGVAGLSVPLTWRGLSARVGTVVGVTAAVTWAVLMGAVQFGTMLDQTRPMPTERGLQPVPVGAWVDRLDLVAGHPIQESRADLIWTVGEQGSLFYLPANVQYATAFDAEPLAEVLSVAEGDPSLVRQELRKRGVDEVWVNFAEVSRLSRSYGSDAGLTVDNLQKALSGLQPIYDDPYRRAWRVPRP